LQERDQLPAGGQRRVIEDLFAERCGGREFSVEAGAGSLPPPDVQPARPSTARSESEQRSVGAMEFFGARLGGPEPDASANDNELHL
jgi:hypothetical protein